MARGLASFKLLGVDIKLDASWILLALLIAWSLAAGTFPALYAGLPRFTYWGMAIGAVLGVAVSIILHELGHTLVARMFGLPVKSITLFIFGGVADMRGEPKAPMAELLMAVAGPLVSLVLGVIFVSASAFMPAAVPPAYHGVLHYLGVLNVALAVFNMVPAFPLDGGRVLRAVIWLLTDDPVKATRIASRAGEIIGLLMMAIGAFAALSGGVVGGLWWVVLGWFIYSLARSYRDNAEAKLLLSGALVRELMTPDPVTAPADISVGEFVETVLARYPHDLVPVTSGNAVVGGAGFKEARVTPREKWPTTRLGDVARPLAEIPIAEADEPVEQALERLQRSGHSRMLVMNSGALVGVLTLKDLAAHLRFRAELARA